MPVILPEEHCDTRILVIGEAPEETEDEEGCPFVGRTGTYLRERIPRYWKNKLYWTNTVRCRPPRNRTPEESEIKCCSEYLWRDIEAINPHAILAVGGVALQIFAPARSVSDFRGIQMAAQHRSWVGWIQSVFHPSYVVRGVREHDEYGYLNPTVAPFERDLKNFFERSHIQRPDIPKIPKVEVPTSYEEAMQMFRRLEWHSATDLETFKFKPYQRDAQITMASFSDGKFTFAVPVWWPGMLNDWGKEFLKYVYTTGRPWIAHNAAFEMAWIQHLVGKRVHFDDTMALARIYFSRRNMLALEDQSLIWLGIDVKTLTRVNPLKQFEFPLNEVLTYCGLDSWAEALVFQRMKIPEVQRSNYERLLSATQVGVDMELLGIPIDLSESQKLADDLGKKCSETEQLARNLPEVKLYEKRAGHSFSISSRVDISTALVDFCHVKLPKTEKGNYRTGEEVLKDIDHPLAEIVTNWRELDKLNGTYVIPILMGTILGVDDRLHAAYKALGTITGRYSSEDPNMQNFPKRKHREIRRQIAAPPGHILASFDYGQLEARVTAMAANDRTLMKDIIDRVDIHTYWLKRALELYPPYWDRLKEKTGETEEKKVMKSGRDVIKFDFVFSSLYGQTKESCAYATGIPLNITTQLLSEFWNRYAGTKQWIKDQFIKYHETGFISTLTGYMRDEVIWGNEVINSPVQGTAAHICLESQKVLSTMGLDDPYFTPRINVHDDNTNILPDGNELENYIETIGDVMVVPRFDFITVPLLVEAKIGYNWADMEVVGEFLGEYK